MNTITAPTDSQQPPAWWACSTLWQHRPCAGGARPLVRHRLPARAWRRCTVAAGAAAVVLSASVAGCAPPSSGAASRVAPPLLYVANALDGTLSRLDARTGRAVGPPVPAGPNPGRVVAGDGGRALALSVGAAHGGSLTLIAPAGGTWQARPVVVEPRARVQHVAGDGGRDAVAAYTVTSDDLRAGPSPCRLALIDLHTGVAARGQPLCAPGERVISLALQHSATGPIAYAGLWRAPDEVAGEELPSGGRLLAIDARSGATTGIMRLEGVPDALALGAGADGIARLHVVEARLERDDGATSSQRRDRYDAQGWRLWALDPATLALLDELPLAYPPSGLAVAPEGDQAYALVGPVDGLLGRVLMRLDLGTGAQTLLGRVPGKNGSSLTVSRDRVYVPNAEGHDIWVGDRQGRPLMPLAAGEHPLDIVLSSPR